MEGKRECIVCLEKKTPDGFRVFVNGELSKICKACHGKKISEARQRNKHETDDKEVIPPLIAQQVDHSEKIMARINLNKQMKKCSDELNGKIIIMDLRDFYAAIRAAHEDGKNSVADYQSIRELDLSKIVTQALEE